MKIKEIHSKSILSPSKIYDYVVNPYVGCQHACSLIVMPDLSIFSLGVKNPWGDFVDVKINAPDLLSKEVKKKKQRERCGSAAFAIPTAAGGKIQTHKTLS